MANPSINKVLMNDNVSFSLLLNTEKTIVLPINCTFVEIVNDSADVYFAVGDRLAGNNSETRLMTPLMDSIIIKPFAGQLQMNHFREISFYATTNVTIRFMNLSPYSLI